MIFLIIFSIYILSIVIIHLYYRRDWIKYLEEASKSYHPNQFYIKSKNGEIDTSLGAFYYWMEKDDNVLVNPLIIFIPILNTMAIFLVVLIDICTKIGTIKFVKLK